MTEEQEETLVNGALDHLVHYLNLWWNNEMMNKGEPDPYKRENFTTWDPGNSLWGETNWKVLYEPEGWMEHGLIRIEATDGDEGGGNTLIVGFRDWAKTQTHGGPIIEWIVQIFDTIATMIYTEGEYRTPPEGKMVKHANH
jgi:hypothetical protein